MLVGLEGLLGRKLAGGGEWDGISTLEVLMRPPEVFVRSLAHEEALRLKRMAKRSKYASTRERARSSTSSMSGGSLRWTLSVGAGVPAGSPPVSVSGSCR